VVALKILRSGLLGEGSAEARFREELKLARKVAHPNVCRIHELFGDDRPGGRVLYFTMEYLEGETLAERLRRGPLEAAEALDAARQIAAGLDAAHAIGILHRDLKPANVFLAGDRVVVTDFGLAKALRVIEEGGGPTLTGQAPGTPAYMSPEQFLGEALTPRSDVFAFGLVVFEMLTGRPPFPREDVGSALRRGPRSLPSGWDRAIDKALGPVPGKRYESAGAMVKDLERSRPAAETPIARRAVLWGGGCAAISLAAFFAIPRFREWGAILPDSPVLMLTPLTHSSDARDAQALDLLMASQIAQSARVDLVSRDRIAESWRRITGTAGAPPQQLAPATARDVALRQGANFVVFGNLGQTGDEYALRLRIELMGSDPAHAGRTWSRDFTAAGRADLPSAAFDGASWIRATLGETEPELRARSRRPEDMTTGSWQALQEFTEADQAWGKRDSAAALLHLHSALDLDPGFALAAFRAGDILTATSRGDEAMPYYQTASDLVRRKNLTDRESLRIRGLFLQDTCQDAEAERVFARWTLEYPRDPLPLFYRATSLDRLGRMDEALPLGRRAIELDPHRPVFVQANAERLLNAGHVAEAETEARHLAAMDASDWTDVLLGALAVGRFDLAEAWRRLERLRAAGSQRFRSLSFALQACFRAEQKRWSEAERLCREGLAFDAAQGLEPERYIKRRQLAQLYLRQGRKRDAAAVCEEILSANPGNLRVMETGCILAQAGEIQAARSCLRPNLPDWPTYRHWSLRLEGEIARTRGDKKSALGLIQQAPRLWVGVWRDDILTAALDAAVESGEAAAVARAQLEDLLGNLGRAWRTAQFESPGFLIHAAEAAHKFDLPEPARKTADRLRMSFATPVTE
jgi:tetratricopeptide (TPR) repeat protein